jgi:hypothetical protein
MVSYARTWFDSWSGPYEKSGKEGGKGSTANGTAMGAVQ